MAEKKENAQKDKMKKHSVLKSMLQILLIMVKWINRLLGKIIVIGVIIGVLFFSNSVLNTAFKEKELLLYESQSSEKPSEEVCGSISSKKATNMQIPKCCSMCAQQHEIAPITKCHCNNIGSKKVFFYHVLCIVFIIVLGITVMVLLAILLNDDSGIRYEKLDGLNSIKDKLLEYDSKTSWGEDTNETIIIKNKKDKSTEITTKRIYNRADLLKHYMNCITDI